jgi:hypothetical protein
MCVVDDLKISDFALFRDLLLRYVRAIMFSFSTIPILNALIG